jgi:hypothetical protein
MGGFGAIGAEGAGDWEAAWENAVWTRDDITGFGCYH